MYKTLCISAMSVTVLCLALVGMGPRAHADTAQTNGALPIPCFTNYSETISTYSGAPSWNPVTSLTHIEHDGDTDVTNDSDSDMYYWDGTTCPSTDVKLKIGKSHTVKQTASLFTRTYSTQICSSGAGAQITLTLSGL